MYDTDFENCTHNVSLAAKFCIALIVNSLHSLVNYYLTTLLFPARVEV